MEKKILTTWESKTTPARMIGKAIIPENGYFFDGRIVGDDVRVKASLNYLLTKWLEDRGLEFTANNIVRINNTQHTPIIITYNPDNFRINERGVQVSNSPADGLVILHNDPLAKEIIPAMGTADCVPLTFQALNCSGIIHIGYKGLFSGIIEELLKVLTKYEGNDLSQVKFSIGPAATNLSFPEGVNLNGIQSFQNLYKHTKLIQVRDSSDSLRLKTFDKNPSEAPKLLIQFLPLVLTHLVNVLNIDPKIIECSGIDTTFQTGLYSHRRDFTEDTELNSKYYSNNLTYLLMRYILN